MKSTSALKMACLSVGLATAWAPLGGQVARAGSVVDVYLQLGPSAGLADPGAYDDVYIGLLFGDHVETYSLGAHFSSAFHDDINVPIVTDLNDISDIKGFMTVGIAGHPGQGNPDVMVSISSPFAILAGEILAWDPDVFPASPESDESFAAANPQGFLTSVLNKALADSSVYANVLEDSFGDEAGLFEFSSGSVDKGDPSGEVSISGFAAAVPLPSACLMGGGLFALMALSKRSVKWIHLHRTQGLA